MLLNCGVGEDSWESLGLQGDPPVNPTGDQSWIFIGRTDAEAETPILLPPDAKNWLLGKDPDSGKDWRQGENEMTEDEMVGWHHQLDGHEFQQALGVGEQGSLVCCSPWGHKESDTTERLNWSEGSSVRVEITFKSASAGPHFSTCVSDDLPHRTSLLTARSGWLETYCDLCHNKIILI